MTPANLCRSGWFSVNSLPIEYKHQSFIFAKSWSRGRQSTVRGFSPLGVGRSLQMFVFQRNFGNLCRQKLSKHLKCVDSTLLSATKVNVNWMNDSPSWKGSWCLRCFPWIKFRPKRYAFDTLPTLSGKHEIPPPPSTLAKDPACFLVGAASTASAFFLLSETTSVWLAAKLTSMRFVERLL